MSSQRCIHLSKSVWDANDEDAVLVTDAEVTKEMDRGRGEESDRLPGGGRIKVRTIDLETGLKYMKSKCKSFIIVVVRRKFLHKMKFESEKFGGNKKIWQR